MSTAAQSPRIASPRFVSQGSKAYVLTHSRVEHLDIAGRAAGVYEDTIFGGGWYEPTDIELLPQDWTEDAELDATYNFRLGSSRGADRMII